MTSMEMQSVFKVLTFCFYIETFLLVIVFASRGIFSEHCNIFPFRWVPIWVIISFFGTFISVSSSVVVLAGVSGCGAVNGLIGCEETYGKSF